MDFLKREQAPVTGAAWQQIDEAVRTVLTARLCGRRVVDVSGPHGLDMAAVGLGHLEIPRSGPDGKVGYGVHRVQPLVEARTTFDLDLWELDNTERGAASVDVGAAEEAAMALARFEEDAVFNGLQDGGITGLAQLSENPPITLSTDPDGLLDGVTRAVMALADRGVTGPYHLVAGSDIFKALATRQTSGFPLRQQVENIIEGRVHYSNVLSGAVLLSGRGGDFELTLGQDLGVGFESREGRQATFFLTESFTFRILDPAAGIQLRLDEK
jgi:uncharacterized linocin/CFP29 family protein